MIKIILFLILSVFAFANDDLYLKAKMYEDQKNILKLLIFMKN